MTRSSVSPASRAVDRSLVTNLLLSLRPNQWTKNFLVFAGLIFSEQRKLRDPSAVADACLAFGIFCLLSGAIYLINDVRDRDADRLHPRKSRRPIASGAISPGVAIGFAFVLMTIAIAGAFAINRPFGLIATTYAVLLGLYSLSLKHMVILDVLTLSLGFVLRAVAGAVAIAVPTSNWLLLVTLLLALFIALSKRRAELVTLAEGAHEHRPSLAEYSPHLLDQMISVVTASTLLAYAFYTISPDTVQKFGTEHLIYTVPFPLYGIFRYLYLVHRREGGGNPSEMLLTDRPLLICVALWVLMVVLVLYGPLK